MSRNPNLRPCPDPEWVPTLPRTPQPGDLARALSLVFPSGTRGERPESQLSMEELRILIAAVAGPARMVVAGRSQGLGPLAVGQPELVARNASAPALFVDVRAIPGVNIGNVVFSNSSGGTPETRISWDLIAAPFQQVLVPHEELWIVAVTAAITPTVMVTEVQV